MSHAYTTSKQSHYFLRSSCRARPDASVPALRKPITVSITVSCRRRLTESVADPLGLPSRQASSRSLGPYHPAPVSSSKQGLKDKRGIDILARMIQVLPTTQSTQWLALS